MSDFEIAGINSLKQALTIMARQPKTISRRDPITLKLMEEIYVEVRQARISGYSWKDLVAVINEKCKIKLHQNSVASLFQELDLKYEKETGIQALPVAKKRGSRKKSKPASVKQETEEGDPEEIGAPVCTYTGKRRGRPKKNAAEEKKS